MAHGEHRGGMHPLQHHGVGLSRPRAGSRVGGVIGAHELGRADVRVALGGGQPAVAQELLDHAEVRAAIEEMGGEGVPQGVRAHPALDPRGPGRALYEGLHAARGERAPRAR